MSDESITETAAPEVRTTRTRESCRHILTTDQLLEAGRQMAEAQNEVVQLEGDFKSVRDDWKARISATESRVATLSGKISRGYDMKDTECTVYMDTPEEGLKACLRNDTGERVWIRDMTDSDRQLVLRLDEEEEKKDEAEGEAAGDPSAVQIIAENVKELAEKSGIHPEQLLKALALIAEGAKSISDLQKKMRLGYTAAAKLWAVAQEAGAPAPEKEKKEGGEEGEY